MVTHAGTARYKTLKILQVPMGVSLISGAHATLRPKVTRDRDLDAGAKEVDEERAILPSLPSLGAL